MLILYTGVKCPHCPEARKVLRDAARELKWKEGKDFVEKIIDGEDLKKGEHVLEGQKYNFVYSENEISEEKTPSAVVGKDFSMEALMHQVASTPSFVFEEEAIFISHVPTKDELLNAIKERV